ncbi:T3SS effector HopA1 family protein [Streptomyces sp. M92]|uniref:T3SS effector HopA1 family protein n=1 Tax=Streptomyces sp. M92 TaxID=2944250 RepID=UPI00234B5950|nr:T3SS effector HopA1 family protein [Streptomyces sp. M92]WCN02196.1 T3SS effector HopA1 family protein [Streptomyces sp. M92]
MTAPTHVPAEPRTEPYAAPGPSRPRPAPRLLDALLGIRVSADLRTASAGGHTTRPVRPGELRPVLAALLYDVVHSGRPHGERTPLSLREAALERELRAAVPHRTVDRPATALAPRRDPAELGLGPGVLVGLNGVRVMVPSETLRDPGPTVALAAARPALSPGFLYVCGSREPENDEELLRVYVHLTDPHRAAGVWAAVLRRLEDDGASYHAKVLSAPSSYPRRDALVVYLGRRSWGACHAVADAVCDLPGVAPGTSAFTHRLGPGTAIAWEPDDTRPGTAAMSFGQHRANALAEAAVRAAHAGLDPVAPGARTALAAVLAEVCRTAGIDPSAPFRNLRSPAVPGGPQPVTARTPHPHEGEAP